ncbi:hypothetical protein Cgig2_010867 [Carnegiea gigantea]|uniref:Uncharacterized protein n=1 Tax=Carnegiea gigantea TaxID=171969 RepID=A0A9Q1JNT8_9CARY|nr:hypothetical protein Cgig2_010867 [Carnegiea gigantea]
MGRNITAKVLKMKALVRGGWAAANWIMTNSQRLAKVIIELEELIPGACNPLKRIDAIEKQFAGSQDKVHDFLQFGIPSFSLRVSQEEKEALLKGIVVDSKPDSLAAAVQEDDDAFIDRSLMRIAKLDLQKPIEKRFEKKNAVKEKCEEIVSKKTKRGNSSQQAREADESLQKCDAKEIEKDSSLEKAEEKKEGKKQNATEKALSIHPNTETSSKKPQQEEQTLEKNPNKIREEAKRREARRNKKGEGKEEAFPVRRS